LKYSQILDASLSSPSISAHGSGYSYLIAPGISEVEINFIAVIGNAA